MGLVGVRFHDDLPTRWLDAEPDVIDCLEIAADGFFRRPSHYLTSLAACRPLIVRASSLSIGTPGPLNQDRLRALAEVSAASNCLFVVHPVGFNASDETHLGMHLPINRTETSLGVVVEHMIQASEACARPGVVEPITAVLQVPGTIAETEFLNRLCREAGCRLLIDVTTLLVASRNHGFNPHSWLADIDRDLIAASRIGGCWVRDDRWRNDRRGALDDEAWALLGDLVARANPEALILDAQAGATRLDALRRDLQRVRNVGSKAEMPKQSGKSLSPKPPKNPRHTRRVAAGPDITSRGDSGSEPIDIAPDASLFVLDDEGVLFCESRQELYLFNTPATLVWCLVEQGLSASEIVHAYHQAFGLTVTEASRCVSALLQQWFGLGYIGDPVLSGAPEIPFTTALARVLINPELRKQFTESPQAVARLLRVAESDVESFLRLDPGELTRQAEEIDRRRAPRRTRAAADPSIVRDAARTVIDANRPDRAPRTHASTAPAPCYRLLTTTFSIFVESEELARQIHAALAHLQVPAQVPDVVLDVRQSDEGTPIVYEGAMPVKSCRRPDGAVPAVHQLLREMAVNRHDFFIMTHAGVVSFGTGCVLLPAVAGSGKTTLTAGLLHAGGTYFSDEIALLEEETFAVRPVTLGLTIKDGSVEPLRRWYPDLALLTPHLREDYQRVRYLPPPAASLADNGQAQRVRWIVFPHYDPDATTALVPLARPAGLRKLLDESLVLPESLDRGKVESLICWMRTLDCFDLPMSSVEAAVGLLRGLMLRV